MKMIKGMVSLTLRLLPLALAISLLPFTIYSNENQAFTGIDFLTLELPAALATLSYGTYAARHPHSVMVQASSFWFSLALSFRLAYYIWPMSLGNHAAVALISFWAFLMGWMETSHKKVWQRPIPHKEIKRVYYPIGLLVAVSGGDVTATLSAFLFWKGYGSVNAIVVGLMAAVTVLDILATWRFQNNAGFVFGVTWEAVVILGFSLGNIYASIRVASFVSAVIILLFSILTHMMEKRRLHSVPKPIKRKVASVIVPLAPSAGPTGVIVSCPAPGIPR